MSSRIDAVETNEFLRRRKLRLQQVREQSKDIARKIRQRANVEKLRHLENIDARKEKEYFECQEKLVKHLELLYSKGLQNVGDGHKNALEVNQQDIVQKIDTSKLRGIEAVAELRKKKQEKLDQQKKLLDRKLQAREAANELSREKAAIGAKNLNKHSSKKCEELQAKSKIDTPKIDDSNQNQNARKDITDVTKNDMATQWESEELPNEWEPNVPALSLPKDDSVKDSVNENIEKIEKSKRLNLFALSDEMPSSLRGGLTGITDDAIPTKPSLTLVSEYLQNRNLRLRQTDPGSSKKSDDLQSIKQTILRTRATKLDGNVFDNVCHVLDEQVIPVPSWQAEDSSGLCRHLCPHNHYPNRLYKSFSRAPIHKFPSTPRSLQRNLQSSPVLKEFNLYRRTKALCGTCKQTGSKDKSSQSTEPITDINRKRSISVYNHKTRNTQNIPYDDERFVIRDNKSEEDAYAQAFKETTIANKMEKDQISKLQKDMRTKVAVTRKSVDKEYKDTVAFLNSLTKDKDNDKPIKTAYMDDHQQKMQNERHQKKLQEEFKKIEKECNKHNCKHSKRKVTNFEKKSSMPSDPIGKHFEYSWMPVPESDGSLAIHTIPNTRNKSGNTVKFQADSYHEYRSRHKHTPPTKDVSNDRQKKNIVETVILQQSSNDSDIIESSISSESSSVENLNLDNDKHKTGDESRLKDADRIIIYKILESKRERKSKDKKKPKDIKSTKFEETVTKQVNEQVTEAKEDNKQKSSNLEKSAGDIQKGVSFEQLKEGVYEAVCSNGDNVTSKYFTEGSKECDNSNQGQKCNNIKSSCCCKENEDLQNTGGDNNARPLKQTSSCKCGNKNKINDNCHFTQPSAATSSTSFTTASNDKTNNHLRDGGFVRLIGDGEQENSKFYIGASGFLKDDNYEVVIQLRKKETEKVNNIIDSKLSSSQIKQTVSDSEQFDTYRKEPLKSSIKTVHTEATTATPNVSQNNEKTVNKDQIEIEIMSVEPNLDSQMCEKAVHTSYQDIYPIPDHVPKTDPISRPATSTFTQTSFNSSIPRPAFMHMSSSTSTAYMSPPELILPKFLKHNYILTKEEIYESENTTNHLDSNFEARECKNCKKNNNCRCRVWERYQLKTPPNTARSLSKERSVGTYGEKKKVKCKCHKCRSRSETNICHKSYRKKSTSSLKTRSSRDLPCDYFNQIQKQSPKTKTVNTHSANKAQGIKLNPIVKNYVDRLLALNNEGLKAIEIINQDCSAVTTPGSSIINLPCNKNNIESTLEKKISLEQIKNILKQQIFKEETATKTNTNSKESQTEQISKVSKMPKKKSVHKIKSLNISKRILKKKKPSDSHISSTQGSKKSSRFVSSVAREENKFYNHKPVTRPHSKSSTSPRPCDHSEYKNSTSSDITETLTDKQCGIADKRNKMIINNKSVKSTVYTKSQHLQNFNLPLHKGTRPSFSSDSDATGAILRHLHPPQPPIHISTQTNGIIDAEINYMKIAEDKLQNMEKIADLTEKCTKRLSNLAKVLEEVRRNKSLVYSQISTSDSETKADKNEISTEISEHISDPNILTESKESVKSLASLSIPEKLDEKNVLPKDPTEFTRFLKNIPKPLTKPSNASFDEFNLIDISSKLTKTFEESENTKSRGKPPPALSRIHLKRGQDVNIIPHELSTVIEVDSPMSIKLKNQNSQQDTKLDILEKSDRRPDKIDKRSTTDDELTAAKEKQVDPDLLQSNINSFRLLSKVSSIESSDESKMRMMDMKKFNDIMLKPFISLKDYAKQCNIGSEEDSNHGNVIKNEPLYDDLSSLHSDSSLPDVIAELLKRNIISEPFKFDTGSNVNSTTLSSESTLSILALSKARKEKKKSGVFVKNKENVAETSETLSLSSNPDLENAFQKLGMGWASSTLKKTKERLALSSSSNTSSSSMTQFKIKSLSQDIPNLATDSTSSLLDVSNKRERKKAYIEEISKNAIQQTSLTNSMTVKEFLTNELAKKITFNNKSSSKEVEEEFVSLYETKMPEEMKHTNLESEEDRLSVSSVTHNRARTSTPVQIFKSQTYHSSSTSNTSNGFFSNADDLSSVKVTSASIRNHSTSDKDDLTIPNYSLKSIKVQSGCSKSD